MKNRYLVLVLALALICGNAFAASDAQLRAFGKKTGATTDGEVVAAVSGKVIALDKVVLTASASTTALLESGGSTAMTGTHELVAGVPLVLEFDKVNPQTVIGEAVTITTSAGNTAYEVQYHTEP